jgi:ABC-type transport system substrate-binding protein
VFQEWIVNDHFTATKNPHYWRTGLPYLDSITYRPIPDPDQLLATFQSGGVDIMHTDTANVTTVLRGDTSLGYIDDSANVAGEPDMGCILLNLSKPPFDNLKLRQAAAYAVSSAQYVAVIDVGVNPTSNGPFTSTSPYYVADNGYPVYDPAKATQLVKEVAQETGQPVSITLNHTPDASTTKDAEYLQQKLQTVGMTVSLSPIQQADIINVALAGTFEAQLWRQFGAVNPDLNYIFWSPTNADTPVFAINMARNSDPKMQTALIQGRQSSNPSQQVAAYQEVSKLMGADIPYVWFDRTVWAIGAQPKVENFNNPTTAAGGKAFTLIGGAIWPTQIWLNS